MSDLEIMTLDEKLLAFQEKWELDEPCMNYMGKLPEQVLDTVIAKFDHRPGQTNVSARCFGFAKSVLRSYENGVGGAQIQNLQPLEEFQAKFGLDHRCVEYLGTLSPEVLDHVMQTFDHRPDQTNVSARCFSFAKKLQQSLMSGGHAPQTVTRFFDPTPPPAYITESAPTPPRAVGTKRKWEEAPAGSNDDQLGQFQVLWDLDNDSIDFIASLPQDVQTEIILNFFHGEGQTNASKRCVAFAKAILARHGHGDRKGHMRNAAPPPISPYIQDAAVPQPTAGSQTPDSALEEFQAMWGIDDRCMEYLSTLPEDVQNQVFAGFSHSPEQTNVSRRCFSFARSIVQRVTSDAQRQQYPQPPHAPPPPHLTEPQEAEMEVLPTPPPAPPSSKARMPPEPPAALLTPDAVTGLISFGEDDVTPLLLFQEKWGVDDKCMEYVANMSPSAQATVIEKFDHRPDQTNVSARCIAFARSVAKSEAAKGQVHAPQLSDSKLSESQVSLLDQFQGMWGIDDRCKEYLASLSPSLQEHVFQNFSHSPQQTNVSARCFSFAKWAVKKFEMTNGWG